MEIKNGDFGTARLHKRTKLFIFQRWVICQRWPILMERVAGARGHNSNRRINTRLTHKTYSCIMCLNLGTMQDTKMYLLNRRDINYLFEGQLIVVIGYCN